MLNKTGSRADTIYSDMKNAILYGHPNFKPDDFLIENKLAEYYNVSKTPVREALNRLRNENLVGVIPYKGYYVTNLSFQDLVDLFELRFILEVNAVKLATDNITTQQIEQLANLTSLEIINMDEDLSLQFRKVNYDFHALVADASGNKWLAATVKQVLQQMQRALFHQMVKEDLKVMFQEHRELLEAIRTKDVVRALEIEKAQIESAKKRAFKK